MSEHKNMNTLVSLFFIILFIVAMIIIAEKTQFFENFKDEYDEHVSDDAKDNIEQFIPISDLSSAQRILQYKIPKALSNI